jgi:hypothetical protein
MMRPLVLRFAAIFLVGYHLIPGANNAAFSQSAPAVRWEYARLVLERQAEWQDSQQPKVVRYVSSIALDRADGKPFRESTTQNGRPNEYSFNEVVPPPYDKFYRRLTNRPPPKDAVLDTLLLLKALGEQGWELVSPVDPAALSTMRSLGMQEFLLKRASR